MTRKEKAVQLFKEGYNCAQSVFGAYADLYEIPADMAFRISASFPLPVFAPAASLRSLA